MKTKGYLRMLVAVAMCAAALVASEHHGVVNLGGLPIPGAIVTATQGDKKVTAVTDGMGTYSFPDLADGTWNIQVEMSGFTTIKQDVTVAAGAPASTFDLKIKSLSEIQAQVQTPVLEPRPATAGSGTASAKPAPAPAKPKPQAQALAAAAAGRGGTQAAAGQAALPADQPVEEANQKAADGLLVNGSQVNGGASPFALNPAFGNNRRGPRSLYNYMLGFNLNNSALDARTYSQTGQNTPKPAFNNYNINGLVGGPLRIPHLFRNGPNFTVQFFMSRGRNDSTQFGLVPTLAQRNGDLSNYGGQLIDPTTLLPFPGNQIPSYRISPQATALLNLFPKPNFTSSIYNYQIPLVSTTNSEGFNVRMNRQIGRKNSIQGIFALQSSRAANPNLFGFLDTNNTLGFRIDPTWRHQWTPRMSTTLEFNFSRNVPHQYSYFSNLRNVSGEAGIAGNNQQPLYWGPPTLGFGASGISGLSDGLPSFNRSQTGVLQSDSTWNHGRHTITFGADIRKQQFNYESQLNPRGSFSFTGAATGGGPGSDLADFLLGIPDASSLAFGNADKYLRATGYDAYIGDDWRVNSALTLNSTLRYEYNAPVSELYGRLVNLDVGNGFTAVEPVLGNMPIGAVSGQHYPSSLIRPERFPFEPGLGLAWRPISGSSVVVRAGYSLRFANPGYTGFAQSMYQQSPLSYSVQASNAASPLTLANGFVGSPTFAAQSFGIDPNFKESYAQNWQISIQKDLPGGMQMQVGYNGIKGTRMPQFFYPNSYAYAPYNVNPCSYCTSGFKYETSNGNLTREAGTLQLRRRLHNGFQASMTYTLARSIDDTGSTAQNWLDLSAERGLSTSDQRHNVQVQLQYTSGMGLHGGALISGWRAAVLKEWTFLVPIGWHSGSPETPLYPELLGGTNASNVLRLNYTGEPLSATPTGLALGEAFTKPSSGQFGNAGVGAFTGPSQFTLNASMQRTFRVNDRVTLNLRVDATNALNHVAFTTYGATLGPQFGVATGAGGMRTMSTTAQFRF